MTQKYAPEARQEAEAKKDLLNGYPVIASAPLPVELGCKNARVVIVDRGEGEPDRYICAVNPYGREDWFHGHYCPTIEAAYDSFTARLTRHYAAGSAS